MSRRPRTAKQSVVDMVVDNEFSLDDDLLKDDSAGVAVASGHRPPKPEVVDRAAPVAGMAAHPARPPPHPVAAAVPGAPSEPDSKHVSSIRSKNTQANDLADAVYAMGRLSMNAKDLLADVKKNPGRGIDDAMAAKFSSQGMDADAGIASVIYQSKRDTEPIRVTSAGSFPAPLAIRTSIKVSKESKERVCYQNTFDMKLFARESFDGIHSRPRYDYYVLRHQWQMLETAFAAKSTAKISVDECVVAVIEGIHDRGYAMVQLQPERFGLALRDKTNAEAHRLQMSRVSADFLDACNAHAVDQALKAAFNSRTPGGSNAAAAGVGSGAMAAARANSLSLFASIPHRR